MADSDAFKRERERDLDLYRQLNQDSLNGRALG